MRESEIEKAVVKWAVQNGWYTKKMKFIGVDGAPDRLFLRQNSDDDRCVVFIEFKKTKGEPRLNQRRRANEMIKHGAHVYAVDSIDGGVSILASFM